MLRKLLIFAFLFVPSWLLADSGDIPLSSNFQLNSNRPLDARIRAADVTARNAIAGSARFDGLIVYQIDTKRTWQLQGDTNTWVDVTNGSSGTVTTATAQQLAYYPNNGIQIAGASNMTTDGSTFTVTGSAVFANGLSSAAWDIAEGLSPGGVVGGQSIWADSTTHTLQVNPNNAGDHVVVLSSITPATNGIAVWKGYGKIGDMGPPSWVSIPSTFTWNLPFPVNASSTTVISGGSTTIVGAATHIGFSTFTASNGFYDYTGSSVALGFLKLSNGYGTEGQMPTSHGSASSATWTTPPTSGGGSVGNTVTSSWTVTGSGGIGLNTSLRFGLGSTAGHNTYQSIYQDVGTDSAFEGWDNAVGIGFFWRDPSQTTLMSLATGATNKGLLSLTYGMTASTITATSLTTLSGGVSISSGITISVPGVITSTTVLTSTMSVVIASCTTRGASPNAWITLTLPASTGNGEWHQIYDVGADSCSIKIAGNGADLIQSSGVARLDAQTQHAYVHSIASGMWGGELQYTPWSVFTTQDDLGTFAVTTASQVTICPIFIPNPTAFTGFRMTRPVANGTNRAVAAIFDMNNKFVVQTSSITLLNSANNYLTGGVTQLAPGWYKLAYTASNTTIAIGGSYSVTDVKTFCGLAGTSTSGMDLSTFAPSATFTAAGGNYPAIDLIFNGGSQGFQ